MSSNTTRFAHAHLGELATAMTALSFILVLGSNLIDLQASQSALQTSLDQHKTAVANSAKVEAQLEALASGTRELAAGGNPNAQRIVETLKQNGVSINAPRKSNP